MFKQIHQLNSKNANLFVECLPNSSENKIQHRVSKEIQF